MTVKVLRRIGALLVAVLLLAPASAAHADDDGPAPVDPLVEAVVETVLQAGVELVEVVVSSAQEVVPFAESLVAIVVAAIDELVGMVEALVPWAGETVDRADEARERVEAFVSSAPGVLDSLMQALRTAEQIVAKGVEDVEDLAQGCTETDPRLWSHPLLDGGASKSVVVWVLLDGVERSDAERLLAPAAGPYEPWGIDLQLTGWQPVDLPADGVASDGRSSRHAGALLEDAAAAVGGRPPAGADLVFVLTGKNLAGDLLGDGVAGQAWCVGGIRTPETSFAASEVEVSGLEGDLDVAKTMAHEVGHLLGAQHHYSNCAERVPALVENATVKGACTLMWIDSALLGAGFSSLSGMVVRGHALRYAGR